MMVIMILRNSNSFVVGIPFQNIFFPDTWTIEICILVFFCNVFGPFFKRFPWQPFPNFISFPLIFSRSKNRKRYRSYCYAKLGQMGKSWAKWAF